MNNNLYIKIIENGLKFKEEFSINEFYNESNFNDYEKKIIERHFIISRESIARGKIDGSIFIANLYGINDYKYLINYEATFNYLEYQELIEARENAENATFLSITAIIIAIITMCITIYQISKPIQINEIQFNQLINSLGKQ